jgi:hypothetical protein
MARRDRQRHEGRVVRRRRRDCDRGRTSDGSRAMLLLLPALHAGVDEIPHSARAFRACALGEAAFAGELFAMLLLRPD